jgi:formyltetrahydrofolate deformylase
MVSQYDHCLADLLHRFKSGELACEIPLVISNHCNTEALTKFYGIDFHHIEVNKDNKVQAEAAQFKLFDEYKIDLIVLARYMQILSPDFVALLIFTTRFCPPLLAQSLIIAPLNVA